MATLSVVHPRRNDASFDHDYYSTKRLPHAAARWTGTGPTSGEALRGWASPEGAEAPYFAIGIIHFDTADDLPAAEQGEHAAEIIRDIRSCTQVEPIIQINERFAP